MFAVGTPKREGSCEKLHGLPKSDFLRLGSMSVRRIPPLFPTTIGEQRVFDEAKLSTGLWWRSLTSGRCSLLPGQKFCSHIEKKRWEENTMDVSHVPLEYSMTSEAHSPWGLSEGEFGTQ